MPLTSAAFQSPQSLVPRTVTPRTYPAICALASRSTRTPNHAPSSVNKIAQFRYHVLEKYECGIELLGTEIKSVRQGKLNMRDGYARVKDGQLYLHNVHISPWTNASSFFNHDPVRVRRLLLHKKDIRKLEAKQFQTGLTIVPMRTYFNPRGYLKVEIALAQGKKLHDKRQDVKRRDDAREMQRIVKQSLAR